MPYSPTALTVPLNQQNSLPPGSFDPAGQSPGILRVIGGVLTRYWDGTALGFGTPQNNVPLAGSIGIVSSVMDTRGCKSLNLVLKRTNPGGAGGSVIAYIMPVFSDGTLGTWTANTQATAARNGAGVALNDVAAGSYIYNFAFGPGSNTAANTQSSFAAGFARVAVIGFLIVGDASLSWEMWGQN